jgi:cytidylate kinase
MEPSGLDLVCVSRTAASGGEEIGRRVAQRLGLRYVDDEIIRMAAENARVDTTVVAEAEWPKSLLMRLADAIDAVGYGLTAPTTWMSTPSQKELRELIRTMVATVAERGRAVIVAHAASVALGSRPGVLRVLVTAPPAIRVERLRASGLVPDADVEATIEDSDEQRQHYLKLFYGIEAETPLHYDLVINTERLTVDQAVEMIVAAARSA